MKRFVLLLVVLGILPAVVPAPGAAQVIVDEPLPVEAPVAKNGTSYHETMCNRMCTQLGKNKKTEVCGSNKKTYNNACSAKCAKISYKRGPCPEEKKEEAPAIIELDPAGLQASIDAEAKRPGGEVRWFDWDKGEGAIVTDDGKELYVEADSVTGDAVESLKEGDRVKFDITPGTKGMHATKVTLELTEEQKKAKMEKAIELEVVEEEKPQTAAAPKQLMKEAKGDDGVYILPSR